MTVADYVIDFFIKNNITEVFGYQGGMIAYLFDSMWKRKEEIHFHQLANEQGVALAACGYAQQTGKVGVVLTTSGPGFTNMLTGIADAWFDSIPLICISGQVNTKDKRREFSLRQMGFQEIQTTQIADPITKKTYEIDNESNVSEILEDAYRMALDGRRGPVFIDLPINICRNEISDCAKVVPEEIYTKIEGADVSDVLQHLMRAEKPVVLAGAGINQLSLRKEFRELIDCLKIPVITTMPAVDLLPTDSIYRVGYLGGTGRREAGCVLATTDCVLTLGTRLCAKAIGYDFDKFAPRAELIRVDIDMNEFQRKVKENEIQIHADLRVFISKLLEKIKAKNDLIDKSEWVYACNKMKDIMRAYDVTWANRLVEKVSKYLPSNSCITADVGNNMVFAAQSAYIKENTRMMLSCGLGAMGYALPAAVGVAIANKGVTAVISGDGGMQMNIQELNYIAEKQLPIKIVVLNNKSLGHIKLFQKAYLEERYSGTDVRNNDYLSCDFSTIAAAYNIRSTQITTIEELDTFAEAMRDDKPILIEVVYEDCAIEPNLHGGSDVLKSKIAFEQEVVDQILNLGFCYL